MKPEQGSTSRDFQAVRIIAGERREDGSRRFLRLEGRSSVVQAPVFAQAEEVSQEHGATPIGTGDQDFGPENFHQITEASFTGGIVFNGLKEGEVKA